MKMSPDEVAKALRWHANDPAGEAAAVKLRAHIAALEKERDAALADNAKFQKALDEAAGLLEDACSEGLNAHFARRVMKDAAEFIALLETDHPGSTLLEEHRKALVRARNEGLEKAANAIETHAKRPDDFDLAHGIRAMKEPE